MMRSLTTALVIGLGLALLSAASGAVFIVDETEQVVITQFGQPVGSPITEAGLYWKWPVIQKVNRFDKRILDWDGDANQIPTRDKRYIWVDTTARWRIKDPLLFMQSVGNETIALGRLDDIIDASTRDAVSNHPLVEVVRNSNRLLDLYKEEALKEEDISIDDAALEPIHQGRQKLTELILQQAAPMAQSYGIELVDVLIKRVNYVEDVRQKVYERMISERKRAAERYRSEGMGRKAEIEGQLSKELRRIESDAYKTAQQIKGKADAQAARIYAQAYSIDPSFYAFVRTLEAYEKVFSSQVRLYVNTDNAFLRYLEQDGRADPGRLDGPNSTPTHDRAP